ncbi:hypothetical protein GCM10025788_28200 [Serinicoccus chungangensis]
MGEAGPVALWAVLLGMFIVAYLRLGLQMWTGIRGLLVVVGLIVLGLSLNLARARSRTTRPRHYNLIEGIAVLGAVVGASLVSSVLGAPGGAQVSWGVAVAAASFLVAPLLGCAAWLGVRAR